MNKKSLVILVIVCAGLIGGLYWWKPTAVPQPAPTSTEITAAKTINVEIRKPDSTKSYELDCEPTTCDLTAFTALQKIGQDDTIAMKFKTYEGLGVMVTELVGLKNGQDNKYWVYEVNGAKVPVSADQYQLRPGDHLLWKFVTAE